MTTANQTPMELLNEIAGLADEGSRMPTERDMRRRLARLAGEIRLWQSEQQIAALRLSLEHGTRQSA